MATWQALAALDFLGLAIVTAFLVRYFAVKTTPWITLITVFISWYLGFFGTLFLPIDIAEGFYSTYTNITNVTEVEYVDNRTVVPANASKRSLQSEYGFVPGRQYGHEGLSFSGAAGILSTAAQTWLTSVTTASQEVMAAWSSDSRQLGAVGYANSSSNSNSTASNDTVVTWEIVEQEIQVRNGPLESLWYAVYWITFLMTYVVIPIVQETVAAGEFRLGARLKTAVRVNIRFYGIMGALGAGALAYVIFGAGFDFWLLLALAISLANTYGLFLVVLFMGYGAAEVPRAIWRRGDAQAELRRLLFQASETEGALFDAKTELNAVVGQVKQLQAKINAMGNETDNQTGPGAASYAELRRCLDIVLAKCSDDTNAPARGKTSVSSDIAAEDEKLAKKAAKRGWGKNKVTISKLAYLHKLLMVARSHLSKSQFRWDRHVLKCIELEHVVEKKMPPAPVVNSRAGRSASMYWSASRPVLQAEQEPSGMPTAAAQTYAALACLPNLLGGALNRALWHFNIYIGPYFWKLMAVVAEVLSILLMWSEATIWVNLQGLVSQNLSVFGHILLAADEQGNHSYVAIQVAAAIPLAWMCICMTFAVFSIRISNYLDLSGNRNTDPYSLCINAALFNRMQFSLAFNYLNVLFHSNNKKDFPDTAFLHSVGAQMKLSVIDWYLPILMVLVYIVCRVNLFERIMRLLGIDEKGSPQKGNPSHEEAIKEGAKLIAGARRRLGLDGNAGATAPHGVDMRPLNSSESPAGGVAGFFGKFSRGTAPSTKAIEMPRTTTDPPASSGTSRFMSLDTFAAKGTPATSATAKPAYDDNTSSSSWANDPWGSSAPVVTSSTTSIGRGTARVPPPAPPTRPTGNVAPKPIARAPTTSTSTAPIAGAGSKGNLSSFASQDAWKPDATFGTSTAGGGNLAALLKGKKTGYGQLE